MKEDALEQCKAHHDGPLISADEEKKIRNIMFLLQKYTWHSKC
jgi:hypothetical protein